jgi:hypothetical protein
MAPETTRPVFDLFIGYAHAADRGESGEKVAALVEAVKIDYLRVTAAALKVFFDTHAIGSMNDRQARMLSGLRQSKMIVAVLSPPYFASDYCRKEAKIYLEDGPTTAKRQADAGPENAAYTRDLFVTYCRMADLAETQPNSDDDRIWSRRAYELLARMNQWEVLFVGG